jgi:sulfur carrier protein
MILTINGEKKEIGDARTVQDLLSLLGLSSRPQGVAVALNGSVVPRSEWPRALLKSGDAVEVIHAVQGG